MRRSLTAVVFVLVTPLLAQKKVHARPKVPSLVKPSQVTITFSPTEVKRDVPAPITVTIHVTPATGGSAATPIDPAIELRALSGKPDKPTMPVQVKLGAETAGTAADYTTSFDIPPGQPLGTYAVVLRAKESAGTSESKDVATAPAQLHLVLSAAPKITGVYPHIRYPENGISIEGENFSAVETDDILLIDQFAQKMCEPTNNVDCVTVKSTSEHRLDFEFTGPRIKGVHQVRVRVGGMTSDKDFEVIFSAVPESKPVKWAIGFTTALAVLVVLIAISGRRRGAPGPSLFTSFFYDEVSKSYSVSYLQFYAWTAVIVLAYAYLTIARSLVQGDFEFSDVPENVPGILMISAGTTLVAAGVNGDKTKGAGASKPSWSDLITTGGLVVPERVQFLVWTLVGITSFLFLVFNTAPGEINTLPKVPQGFLYLMGISSAGYLGGKFARQAGPVISSVAATPSSLKLEIEGRNISIAPLRIQLDGVEVLAAWQKVDGIVFEDDKRYAKHVNVFIESATFDRNTKKVTLPAEKKTELATPFRLTVINADSQKAEQEVTLMLPNPAPRQTKDAKVQKKAPDTVKERMRRLKQGKLKNPLEHRNADLANAADSGKVDVVKTADRPKADAE
jgi:hypothetical protein